jgi:hypothetical protein
MRRVTKAELEEMLEERDQTLEELRAKIDQVLGYDEEEEDEETDED